MRSEAGWPHVLERAAAARTVLLLGDTGTGKTSLVTWLAGAHAARGLSVGVVDTDVGQSHIGPPGTVGLGRVRGAVDSLAEAETLALHWVGSTSPPGVERELWAGARRLVEGGRAAGLGPILVDTCGLVRGRIGYHVAAGTIAETAPDLIICLQRADECAPILEGIDPRGERVLTLAAGPAARRRSIQERRRHRESALDRYFAAARTREIPLSRLAVAAGVDAGEELVDRLVGLLDDRGATLGIGRVAAVDAMDAVLVVETPCAHSAVHRVVPGRDVYRPVLTPEGIP